MLHRVKLKAMYLEEQIPVEFIEELVQSLLISDCKEVIQGNPVRNEVLKVRDRLITLKCCHCVSRVEELKTFSPKEAASSTFIHADSVEKLHTSIFTYSVFNHKLGHKEEAGILLTANATVALDSFIRFGRSVLTNKPCRKTCPVFPSSSKPQDPVKCYSCMSFQQQCRGLTSTFKRYSSITDEDLKGKEVTTRKLRKSNITAFRTIFKSPEEIEALARFASHNVSTQNRYYDFSSKLNQQIKAHQLLGTARTQATNLETDQINVTRTVENILQEDFRNGRTTDIKHLWETIKREWPYSTLLNKATYILEVLKEKRKKH